VRIQKKVQSGEPMHQHLGVAYLPNGLGLFVREGSSHIGEEHDVVIDHASRSRGRREYHLAARILEHTVYDV